jgi:hypothetical protein
MHLLRREHVEAKKGPFIDEEGDKEGDEADDPEDGHTPTVYDADRVDDEEGSVALFELMVKSIQEMRVRGKGIRL